MDNPSPGQTYLRLCRGLIDRVEAQMAEIRQAAQWFAATIRAGRMVHVFGSGHSRIMVSLSFHNLVVGANGQRQAMYLENVSGLAERILRNFALRPEDSALVISSSGCNLVPIEIAEGFQKRKVKVVSIISRRHSEASTSRHAQGRKLQDFSDLVLDTGAPVGDAMVKIEGLEPPVAPGSTVGGCLLINALKAEVAKLLTESGQPPKALAAAAVVGATRAAEIFESAYDEHAHRIARIYAEAGT